MAAAARIDELKKRYEENQRRFFAPLANEYRKAGDLELAIAICRQHLADAPSNLSGQIVYGQALFDAGSFDESRLAFEIAIGLDPENLIALRHLGDIARGQNDYPRAREWYQRVLDADRRNDEVIAIMREMEAGPPPSPVETAYADHAGDSGNIDLPAADAPASPFAEPEPFTPPAAAAPLSPAETPTVPIPAMRRPTPVVPPPVVPPEPEPALPIAASEGGQTAYGFDIDLSGAGSLPAAPSPPRDTFSFAQDSAESTIDEAEDVELPPGLAGLSQTADEFATDLPTPVSGFEGASASAAAHYADDAYGDDDDSSSFGVVEIPDDSPFGAAETAHQSPFSDYAASEPVETAPIDDGLDFDEPDGPAAVESTAPVTDAFDEQADGQEDDWSMPEPVAPAPAETVEPVSSFESFDPVRQMPTPVAPVAATSEFEATEVELVPEPPAEHPAEESAFDSAPQPVAPEAFATETMAELYARQGMRAEAIGVYRQLLSARPGDAGLQARLASLEGQQSPTLWASARVFFAGLSSRKATPTRAQTSIPEAAAPPAPAVEDFAPAPPLDAGLDFPTPESVPAVEPTAPVAEVVGSGYEAYDAPIADSQPAETVPEPTPIVSEVWTSPTPDHAWEPAPATPTNGPIADFVADAAPVEVEPPPPEPVAAANPFEELFGSAPVAATEDQAAGTLADAFGGVPASSISGRPARQGTDDVTLDKVFRKPAATPPGGLTAPRQSSSLRFDQFFAPSEPAPPPSDVPALDPGTDGEQFQAWLSGLKKP